ncbi:MAG: hypothetical protein Q3986_07805 [Akkermansia sp.]|nr:hypothetical protein [Akkermansia sp.]
MKRIFLIPACAMLAMGLFTSCQKETESAQQLAEDLTAELQKVTDYKTAEAAAPRVKVLNTRFQNAAAQVLSLNYNPLADSVKPVEQGGPADYVAAVTALAKEIGRVRASKPVTSSDGDIDDTRLLQTVGANAGAGADAKVADALKKGNEYMKNPTSRQNNNPPAFAECYGSEAMVDALSYVADVEERGSYWDSEDLVEVPAEQAPAAEEDEAPAEEPAAAEEPATPPAPAADEEPAVDEEPEPAADDDSEEDSADIDV